jgi:hypothetical protein
MATSSLRDRCRALGWHEAHRGTKQSQVLPRNEVTCGAVPPTSGLVIGHFGDSGIPGARPNVGSMDVDRLYWFSMVIKGGS